MASWVVLEAPQGAAVPDGEELVLLRDGFSFLAFLFPPLWLLWHRLWVEAVAVFAVLIAVAGAEQVAGLAVSLPLQLLVSIFIGLEGNGFRIARRRRLGWQVVGVVDGGDEGDAETRYAAAEEGEDERPADRQPIVPAMSSAAQPSLGLLLNPGR